MKQLRILDVQDPPEPKLYATAPKANPCVRIFGPGPEGVKCKDCAHLWRKRFSRTYYKCDLRGNTNGPGTDHRVNWPACSQFVPRAEAR